jgi:hypothetical protein
MIRSLVLALCLALPLSAFAQDDASLLAPLAPHPTKSHRKKPKHRHNDLDQLAPLNLPTTLTVNVPGVEDAQVVVDGKDWGTAPVNGRKVRPGAHRIRVSRPGFAPFKRRVVVRTGDRAHVAARLRPVAGVLTVRSTPPGAEVSLDGERLGPTPLVQKVLKPGSYELRLRMEGFMNDLSRVALRAGQDTVIARTLVAVPKPLPVAEAKPVDRPVQVALSPTVAPEPGPLPTEQYAEVEPPKAWYQHWYVWAGAGAVVAAAAVGLAASSGGTTVGAPPLAASVCGGACDGVLTP